MQAVDGAGARAVGVRFVADLLADMLVKGLHLVLGIVQPAGQVAGERRDVGMTTLHPRLRLQALARLRRGSERLRQARHRRSRRVVVYGAIKLVDGAKGALGDCWALCPQHLVALRVLGVGRFGKELIAAARFLPDVLVAEIQRHPRDQPGLAAGNPAMNDQGHFPGAWPQRHLYLFAEHVIAGDHQGTGSHGQCCGRGQAQCRP